MKIIYKNTEVSHNVKDYNELINKPSLNGVTLQGNVSLDTLSMYDKPTTKKLVDATSQIRLVTEMPADPEPNMTYYVGPDERGLYDVILVNDAKQQIHMGTTQFGQYKSGPGINVKVDNTININTDDVSVYIDSEGNIASSLDGEALPAFIGSTASTVGQKGLVPKPLMGQQNYALFGDSTWKNLVDVLYPIDSIYLTYDSTINPNTIFSNTTWEKITSSNDRCLWINNNEAGTLLEPGLPSLLGDVGTRPSNISFSGTTELCSATDAFSIAESKVGITEGFAASGLWGNTGYQVFNFKASDYSAIYKGSNDVIPPRTMVCVWRRTA